MPRIQAVLDENEELRDFLFIRGFLLTDDPAVRREGYPFFGAWNCEQHGAFYLWTHRKTLLHTCVA